MISAIIIDSEIDHSALLSSLLKDHCKNLDILSISNSSVEALRAIHEHKPKLIFLHIEMPEMDGFQLLKQIRAIDFEIILMSEHDKHAKEAMHCGAIDFLLKPVNLSDLKIAVEKSLQQLERKFERKLVPLIQTLHEHLNLNQNIALPTLEGLQMVAIRSIIYCSSQGNYTNFILKDKQKLHVCRTLKQVENLLQRYHFIRVHHSFIVNVNEVKKYIKGEGGSVIMSDDTNINVSRSHKEMLLITLQNGRL